MLCDKDVLHGVEAFHADRLMAGMEVVWATGRVEAAHG